MDKGVALFGKRKPLKCPSVIDTTILRSVRLFMRLVSTIISTPMLTDLPYQALGLRARSARLVLASAKLFLPLVPSLPSSFSSSALYLSQSP